MPNGIMDERMYPLLHFLFYDDDPNIAMLCIVMEVVAMIIYVISFLRYEYRSRNKRIMHLRTSCVIIAFVCALRLLIIDVEMQFIAATFVSSSAMALLLHDSYTWANESRDEDIPNINRKPDIS